MVSKEIHTLGSCYCCLLRLLLHSSNNYRVMWQAWIFYLPCKTPYAIIRARKVLQAELVVDAHLLDVFGALLFLPWSLLHDCGKCSSILNTGSAVMAKEAHRRFTSLYWLSSGRSGPPLILGDGAPMVKLLESRETPPLLKHVIIETYSDQTYNHYEIPPELCHHLLFCSVLKQVQTKYL